MKHLRQAWRCELGEVPDRELPRVRVEARARAPVYSRYTPTRSEIYRILAAVRIEWVRRALVLLATTGARVGEVASATWGQVAADGSSVELRGKTGARVVPLHPTVAAEVRSWDRGASTAGVWGVSPKRAVVGVQHELARVSEALELGGRVSPNGLRRSLVDALYDAGAHPDVEAALLGHSPQTALATYRRIREDRLRSEVVRTGLGLPTAPGVVLAFPGAAVSHEVSPLPETEVAPDEEYSQGESNPCLRRERALS